MKLTTYFRAMEMAEQEIQEFRRSYPGLLRRFKQYFHLRSGLIRRMERAELISAMRRGKIELLEKMLEEAEAKE